MYCSFKLLPFESFGIGCEIKLQNFHLARFLEGGSPVPLTSDTKQLNEIVLQINESTKKGGPFSSKCCANKDPFPSKAVSTEWRLKICSPSQEIANKTWMNDFQWDDWQNTIHQSLSRLHNLLYFGVHLQYLLKILVENVHNKFMFESYYVTLFIKVCTNSI